MKPGWKSSECWHTAIAQALALCTVFGLVGTNDSKTLEEAATKCITAVFALCANGYIVLSYIKSRLRLKLNDEGGSMQEQITQKLQARLPFWFAGGTALVLCLAGGNAQAQSLFPWRSSVEQRLQQHEQAMNALKQQQAAPAPVPQAPPQAQPPQYIVLAPQYPPAQQFPIQGAPLQSFPIQGQPQQTFPIQGQPKQVLPIQGQPEQALPIQGPPLQQMPIQGQPQPLPIAPPAQPKGPPVMPPAATGQPMQYTVRHALWRE